MYGCRPFTRGGFLFITIKLAIVSNTVKNIIFAVNKQQKQN